MIVGTCDIMSKTLTMAFEISKQSFLHDTPDSYMLHVKR